MLDKAQLLKDKFDALTLQLSDPAVLADSSEIERIARERSRLEPIAVATLGVLRLEKEIAEARESLADPELAELAREEIAELEPQLLSATQALQELLAPRDSDADRSVIVEIRQGSGGEEAALWAGDLFRMYSRYAEERGWKLEPISLSEAEMGGIKEIVFGLEGAGAWEALQGESGVHRVQRVPATEQKGRVHTSAASVAVLPEAEEVDIDLDERDVEMETMRASGAGGQSVQKNETAVRLIYKPTGMIVTCQDERSLRQNREKAMRVLRSRLYEIEREKQAAERDANRKAQVKSGDRSDKIRTYNFSENRVADHRINWKSNSLDQFMQGRIDELIQALIQTRREEMLQASADL